MKRTLPFVIAMLALLPALTGCPTPFDPTGADTPYLDEANNGTFKDATALPLSDTRSLRFRGEISAEGDVDVYDLGTLAVGDRVTVDVQAVGNVLDPIMAIFDADENLQALNDDRVADGTDLNPYLDFVIRGKGGAYFLAIAAFPSSRTTGSYEVGVEIDVDAAVALPEPAVVFFDWDGGNVSNPSLGQYSLVPFDAAQVGLSSSDTEELKDRVQDVVADRYSAYNFLLYNSDDDDVPAVPHATIYFGGNSHYAFALSEHIDVMNAQKEDVAIVFTRAFDGAFIRDLTLAEMGTAMGNTVAHEIGHLMGLVHTSDCLALMDSTCSNESLLLNQQFKRAPIDDGTFPIGWQDAAELLGWMLGLSS